MHSIKRVLVTGAAGFAGGYLLEALSRRDIAVVATYLRTAPFDPMDSTPYDWRTCDVRDADAVQGTLHAARPDAVVHLAAISVPVQANADPLAAYNVNVGGWLNVLEAARKLDRPCRLLLVSSSHVYGHQPCGRDGFHERMPVAPHDVYAATRAAGEMLARVYAAQFDLDIVVARAFNHCGPRQRPDYFVARMAQQIADISLGRRDPTLQVGNLDAVRDFTDVRDVATAYLALLERGARGQIYNVCSGRPVALQQIVDILQESCRRNLRIESDPRLAQRADVPTVFGDPERLRRATGWEPTYELAETLHDTLTYWKERAVECPTLTTE